MASKNIRHQVKDHTVFSYHISLASFNLEWSPVLFQSFIMLTFLKHLSQLSGAVCSQHSNRRNSSKTQSDRVTPLLKPLQQLPISLKVQSLQWPTGPWVFSLRYELLQGLGSTSLPAHSYRPPVCFAPRPGQANSYLGLCSLFLECSFQNICLVHPLTSFKSLLKCLLLIQAHSYRPLLLQPASRCPNPFPHSCFLTILFFFLMTYFYAEKKKNLKLREQFEIQYK